MTLRITLYIATMTNNYSNPSITSADEELTALPVDTDDAKYVEHEFELRNDLDLDVELAAAVHDNDDNDVQRRSEHLAFSDV